MDDVWLNPAAFARDVGTTARIQRRVPHGQPEKTLENEAALPTAFRNEAATSGLGAFENPNGKTPREARYSLAATRPTSC